MSLKENIGMIKEELNSEEKFFEKAVITERFVKKYKNFIIGTVAAVVLLVVSNAIIESNKAETIKEANKVLMALEKDATDKNAAAELKNLSPALYDVWSFSKALADKNLEELKKLQNSKAMLVSDLATYEVATQTNDSKALSKYASKENAIYKDLAIVQGAIILLNKNEVEKAHMELKKVSADSALKKVVLSLSHYGVK